MIKIEDLLEKIKHNNLDFNKGLNYFCEEYWSSCMEILDTGNINYIPYIMETLIDWHYNRMTAYQIGDLIVGCYLIDSAETVKIILLNIDKMYPHAKKGLEYILSELMARKVTKEYIYTYFKLLNLEKKQIFKEVYNNILLEYPRFSIPEIDEALKSIA